MDKKTLIEHLNEDLSGELQAIVQYLQHSFLVKGLGRLPIHDQLESNAKDEMGHAETLAERIVAMGGVPTVKPRKIIEATATEAMLEADLGGENRALADYAIRIKEAEEAGEIGTALILENILVDEQGHADGLVMLLRK
jgi:bacterioferritin